jgi:hypothetical protein
MPPRIASITGNSTRRPPWNMGKIIGPKPPLRQGHVWSSRIRLQLEKRIRKLWLKNALRLGCSREDHVGCLLGDHHGRGIGIAR